MRYEFATKEPPKLRFAIGAGRIEVETAEGAETTVVDVEAIRGDLENLKVEQHGRDIVIEGAEAVRLQGRRVRDPRPRPARRSDVDANIASAELPRHRSARRDSR